MINPQYKNRARLSILIKSLDRGSQKPTNQHPINQACNQSTTGQEKETM